MIVVQSQLSNFSAISWREQVNFQWDNDEVRFVLDQYGLLDFHSASSLKQQSAGRHVAPLRNDAHIQNTLQNIGIQKQEDLYKSVSLMQIRKIKQVLKWILNKQNGTSDIYIYIIFFILSTWSAITYASLKHEHWLCFLCDI